MNVVLKIRRMRPGKHPHSIIETAVLGYDYGSERGQIKEITDHNQILPLYDFGIGTYDFDMSAVQLSASPKFGRLKLEEKLNNH